MDYTVASKPSVVHFISVRIYFHGQLAPDTLDKSRIKTGTERTHNYAA